MANPYNVLAKISYAYIKPYTNFNHTCPYLVVNSFSNDFEKIS